MSLYLCNKICEKNNTSLNEYSRLKLQKRFQNREVLKIRTALLR